MLSVDSNISAMINSPVRKIGARVELYNGSTLLQIFKYSDLLKSFSVDRVGEDSKFFGECYKGDIVIPQFVIDKKGQKYEVTAIDDKCFYSSNTRAFTLIFLRTN